MTDNDSDAGYNSENTFDSSSSNSLPSLEIDIDGVRDKWQHLMNKFLEPNIKHVQGFKHVGYHLSIYLYFRNLSEKKGNFVPTKRNPFQVIDKEGVPLNDFKKFCLNELNIAHKHYLNIIKHGNIFHFKRTMKLNNPDSQPEVQINKHYAKLWDQLKIYKI